MLLALYRTATHLGAPLIALHLRRRARLAKEETPRLGERSGRPSADRPAGPLLWMHAASVGESLAALPLIEALLAERPTLHILVTTGTVTSAKLMAARLPARTIHQFVPVDRAPAWRTFLSHWRPDLGCLIESEIWPNLILEAENRGLPLAVINGRMSPRSFRRWQRVRSTAARLFGRFELCLARSERDGEYYRSLGAGDVRVLGDLKHAAWALPADQDALCQLRQAIGTRTVWLAASTHPGEEQQILAAHNHLVVAWSDLLTIIVPRHPDRGRTLATEIRAAGFSVAQRSERTAPDPATAIYLADTLGELGLFYRLATIAFIGGSLVPHGGQNPLEAVKLGCPTLFGPHTGNFEEMTERLVRQGASRRVRDADHLGAVLGELFNDSAARTSMAGQARQARLDEGAVLDRILLALAPLLDRQLGQARVADRSDACA